MRGVLKCSLNVCSWTGKNIHCVGMDEGFPLTSQYGESSRCGSRGGGGKNKK